MDIMNSMLESIAIPPVNPAVNEVPAVSMTITMPFNYENVLIVGITDKPDQPSCIASLLSFAKKLNLYTSVGGTKLVSSIFVCIKLIYSLSIRRIL